MASTTYEQKRFCEIKRCGKIDLFGNVPVMVRNAGQLPQPFWLGAACGGGSCSAARCAKIALLRYVERLPLPDIAAQTHYSRTAIGYRLKGIEKVFE